MSLSNKGSGDTGGTYQVESVTSKASHEQISRETTENKPGSRVTRSRSSSVEKEAMDSEGPAVTLKGQESCNSSTDNEVETKFVLKETPVKTPTKQTARMKVGGDTRKMLLKQIKKRTQGISKKRRPPKRSPKGPLGPAVDAEDLLKNKGATQYDQYTHSISAQNLCGKVQSFPIRQKFTQGINANLQQISSGALKEDNRGVVQIHARKMLHKAKNVKQLKARINKCSTNQIDGVTAPVLTNKSSSQKRHVTGPIPNFGAFLEKYQETLTFGCSSDSDNENIPLNRQRYPQKSVKGPVNKTTQKEVLPSSLKPSKNSKGTIPGSSLKNNTAKAKPTTTGLKSSRNVSTPDGKRKPSPGKQPNDPEIRNRTADSSPKVVPPNSLEGPRIHDEQFELGGNDSDMANPIDWQEDCDDYELVEMMERTDVLDCCTHNTSPAQKVAYFSHRRGQFICVPQSHPALVVAPLPPVEELDIPDAIRANILYQKAKESEKKDYERDSELVLTYGYQWMRVPVGGPRYPPSTLRHLAKMNRTSTDYWRQMHTPAARFAQTKKRVIKRRTPAATVTRAEYKQQYEVSHGATAVSTRQVQSIAQIQSADIPQLSEIYHPAITTSHEEMNSSTPESYEPKIDDVRATTTENSDKDQDDVFINPPVPLPDVRNSIPVRGTRSSKRLMDIEEESALTLPSTTQPAVFPAQSVSNEPPPKKKRKGRRKSFDGPLKSELTEQEAKALLKTQFSDSCDSQEEVDLNQRQSDCCAGNQSDKSSHSEHEDGAKIPSPSDTASICVKINKNIKHKTSHTPNAHDSNEIKNRKTAAEPSMLFTLEELNTSEETTPKENTSQGKEASKRPSLCKELNQLLVAGCNWSSKAPIKSVTDRKSRYESNETKHFSPEKKSPKNAKSSIRTLAKPLLKRALIPQKKVLGQPKLGQRKITNSTRLSHSSSNSSTDSPFSDCNSSDPSKTHNEPMNTGSNSSVGAENCSKILDYNTEKPKRRRKVTKQNTEPKDPQVPINVENVDESTDVSCDPDEQNIVTGGAVDEEVEDNLLESKPQEKGEVGRLVWARFSKQQWWPAVVIHGSHCGMKPSKPGHLWVYWFGDRTVAQVAQDNVETFTVTFSDHVLNSGTKLYKKSVLEAIQECWTRAELPLVAGGTAIEDVEFLAWARGGFYINKIIDHDLYVPKGEEPLSQDILKALHGISNQVLNDSTSEVSDEWIFSGDDDEVPQRLFRIERKQTPGSGLNLVKTGVKKIEEICISCDDPKETIVVQHPLFEGGLCEDCKNDIMESIFAFGEDGTNVYCVTCGNGGKFFICEDTQCNRVYCTGCIKDFMNEAAIDMIDKTDNWLCFLCKPYTKKTHGLFHAKSDWQQNIIKLFQPKGCIQPPIPSNFERRPIRVLSLFDGIATGAVVLDALGIDVDVYYASEIDVDAKTVSSIRFPNIIDVGDVKELGDDLIKEMCPIDLLIGGSPCNDLCTVNPSRKGLSDLEGTGPLFFEFYRIMNTVQQLNEGNHLFWLFENVSKMGIDIRNTISKYLKCEPALWDAKYFTAQKRRRLFWGNIPGMYSPPQHAAPDKTSVDLNDFLMSSRTASVEKMRSLTTRTQRKNPVKKGERGEKMWIPELEKVFGFPEHYTDVGDLAPTKRQRLLGKSWSVPVIKHLFRPLTQFFSNKTAEINKN